MNEEEIINKAKLIINNHREIDKMMVIEMVELVQGLLDLYNKEKEKNKELEEENLEKNIWKNKYIEQVKYGNKVTLYGDAVPQVIDIIKKNYVSKDKIKEKMQQDIYTNEHTILGGRRHGKTLEYGIRLGRIQMCEELLEERK